MKILLNTSRKPLSLFEIPSLRTVQCALMEIYRWRHYQFAGNLSILRKAYDRRTFSNEHKEETTVPLSESVIKNCVQLAKWIQHYDVCSSLQERSFSRKPSNYGDTIYVDNFDKNVVPLPESVTNNCIKHPPAIISRRRLLQFAKEHFYGGNGAW